MRRLINCHSVFASEIVTPSGIDQIPLVSRKNIRMHNGRVNGQMDT